VTPTHKKELITWSYKKIEQVVKQSGFYNSGVIFYTIKTNRLVITNKTGLSPDLVNNNNYYHALITNPAKDIINLTQVYIIDQKYKG
jgi:endonuclease III-like uncharacterized protein